MKSQPVAAGRTDYRGTACRYLGEFGPMVKPPVAVNPFSPAAFMRSPATKTVSVPQGVRVMTGRIEGASK